MKAKAVIVGLLIDILGSFAVGIALAIVVVVAAIAKGDVSPAALAAMQAHVLLRAVGLVGTLFCTALGGYAAARLSKPSGIINAIAVGCASLLLAMVLAAAAPGVTPPWKLIAGLVLTVPAAYCGGRIAVAKE
jgi:FtsH-binding integral membrane protein